MAKNDNVAALLEADKAVHADMAVRYKDGPYQDGMYGTGMLLELARRGFVVVPTQAWTAAIRHNAKVGVSTRQPVGSASGVDTTARTAATGPVPDETVFYRSIGPEGPMPDDGEPL